MKIKVQEINFSPVQVSIELTDKNFIIQLYVFLTNDCHRQQRLNRLFSDFYDLSP